MKVEKAIIPIAGYGTRFLPASKEIPKELFPIFNIPVIQYVIEEAIASGIKQIILVSSRHKRSVEDYFDQNHSLEEFLKTNNKFHLINEHLKNPWPEIVVARQHNQLGLGHAISCAKHIIGKNPFAVLLPDEIFIGKINVTALLIKTFECFNAQSVIAAIKVPMQDVSKYGIISMEEIENMVYRVLSMVEKPTPEMAPSSFACPGRYVFSTEIFNAIDEIATYKKGSEMELTSAINLLSKQSSTYAIVPEAKRFDTGYPLGLFEFSLYIAARLFPHHIEHFQKILSANLE